MLHKQQLTIANIRKATRKLPLLVALNFLLVAAPLCAVRRVGYNYIKGLISKWYCSKRITISNLKIISKATLYGS